MPRDTENEAEEIAQAIRKVTGIVGEKIKRQADEVDRRHHASTKRKQELPESLEFELTDNSINDFLRFRDTVAVGLSNPTFEDRRRWLEIPQTRVTVENQIAVITCRLGGEPLQYHILSSVSSLSRL